MLEGSGASEILGPQVHTPAPSMRPLCTQTSELQGQLYRPSDLQQMLPGWDTEADVRQDWGPSSWLWGFKGGSWSTLAPRPSLCPLSRPRKLAPILLAPAFGLLALPWPCGQCLAFQLLLPSSPSVVPPDSPILQAMWVHPLS